MGFIQNLFKRKHQQGESQDKHPTGYETSTFGGFNISNAKSSELLDEFKGWVAACVDAISDEIASIQLKLFEVKTDGTIEEVVDNEILELLFQVNEFTTKFDFFSMTSSFLELTGESPWWVEKDGSEKPINVYFLQPDKLTPVPSDDGTVVKGYIYRPDPNQKFTLQPDEVIFIKFPNPANPFRGKGTLEKAARTVDIDNFSEQWNMNFFKNSARPDSILTIKDLDQMDQEQRDRLKNSLEKAHRDVEKSHKLLVLWGDMTLEKYSQSQKDMDFNEGNKFNRDKILGIFRVPKAIIAQTDGVNFASAKAAQFVFAKYTIKPKMERLVQQMNEFLLPMFSNTERMFLDFESPVPEDKEFKLKEREAGVNKYLTINEVREQDGLPEVEGGDVIYFPLNLVPLGSSSQPIGEPQKVIQLKVKGKKVIKFNPDRIRQMKARNPLYWKIDALKKLAKGDIKEKIKALMKKELNSKTVKKVFTQKQNFNFWKKQNAKINKFMPQARRAIRELFEKQRKIAKQNLKKNKAVITKLIPTDITLNTKEAIEDTLELTLPILSELFKESGDETYDFIGLSDSVTDINEEGIKKLIGDNGQLFAKGITDTTNSMIIDEISQGLKIGEGITDLTKRIDNVFDLSQKFRATRIARTESVRYQNLAIEQTYIDSGIIAKKVWQTDGDPCPRCISMQGKTVKLGGTFIKDGSKDPTGVKIDFTDVVSPPLHANSIWDGSLPVFTPEGKKRIMDIVPGEFVLTHTGQFRKVLATPRKKKIGKRFGIYIAGEKITTTDEHLIMTKDGWKRADELKVGDEVSVFFDKCKCGKEKPVYRMTCSLKCKYYGSMITKKAHQKMEQLAKEGKHPFQQKWVHDKASETIRNNPVLRKKISERMKKNNPSRIPEVRKRMTESYMKTMLEHPERHPNRIMAQKGFISSLEKSMKEILDSMKIKYSFQHPVNRFFVDFALEDHKIAIECDGEYWHKENDKKDLERQKIIENLGWTVLRFRGRRIIEDVVGCKLAISNVLKNHNGEFKESFKKIDRICKTNIHIPKMTYDLTVEHDESFILSAITVHNCECVLVPEFESVKVARKLNGKKQKKNKKSKIVKLQEKIPEILESSILNEIKETVQKIGEQVGETKEQIENVKKETEKSSDEIKESIKHVKEESDKAVEKIDKVIEEDE